MIRPLAFGQRTLFTNIVKSEKLRQTLNTQDLPNERVTWQNPQSKGYRFAILTNQGTNHLDCYQKAQEQLLLNESIDNTTWTRQSKKIDADFTTLAEAQLTQKYHVTATSAPRKRAQGGY